MHSICIDSYFLINPLNAILLTSFLVFRYFNQTEMQTINPISPFEIQVIQQRNEECDHTQFLIEEKESKEEDFYEDLDRFEENGTQESRISPYTFCKAFPFHIIFDRDLVVTQCGNAIYRVLPQVKWPHASLRPETKGHEDAIVTHGHLFI